MSLSVALLQGAFIFPLLLLLLVLAILAIPILARVFGEAARRNPNRPRSGEDERREREENEGSDRNGRSDER